MAEMCARCPVRMACLAFGVGRAEMPVVLAAPALGRWDVPAEHVAACVRAIRARLGDDPPVPARPEVWVTPCGGWLCEGTAVTITGVDGALEVLIGAGVRATDGG